VRSKIRKLEMPRIRPGIINLSVSLLPGKICRSRKAEIRKINPGINIQNTTK
jgi:hypothetical protein